jgi:hypothetical protein
MKKYYVLAKQIDNAPQSIELWVESHESEESAVLSAEEYTINSQEWVYVSVVSKAFKTSVEAQEWANQFRM